MDPAELMELYQEIILDHNKRPRNFRRIECATHAAHGHNPLCGDEVNVYLVVEDGIVTDIAFDGEGCAISKASTSLMTERVKGKTLEEARKDASTLFGIFSDAGEEKDTWTLMEEIGDLAALSGVRRFPARIKCATLSWHAMLAALEGKEQITTE